MTKFTTTEIREKKRNKILFWHFLKGGAVTIIAKMCNYTINKPTGEDSTLLSILYMMPPHVEMGQWKLAWWPN